MISRQFLVFVVAGGVAAAANFGSRILLGRVMPYVPSIIAAYAIGMATAFLLNRRFVFTTTDTKLGHQTFWFTVVNALAVAQTVLISLLFARWVFPQVGMGFHPATIAHGIGVAVPVFTSFVGHKALTFRARAT